LKKRSINIVVIVGLVLSFGGLGYGFHLEGGEISALFGVSAILIIFGGTLGSTVVMMSEEDVKSLPKTLKKVFVSEEYDYQGVIEKLTEWTTITRREGTVELESASNEEEDPFIQKGIGYILEGNEYEAIETLMNIELEAMMDRHEQGARPYEQAGGIAPTMGIIGAVMGLVVVLAGLGQSGVEELGKGISVAFLATLMGIGFANLVCLPFAENLKRKSEQEVLYKTIVIEGILGIHTGTSAMLLRRKLEAYLPEEKVTEEEPEPKADESGE